MNAIDQALRRGLPERAPSRPRAARIGLELLAAIEGGSLELVLPGGEVLRAGEGERAASVWLDDWRFFDDALERGDIGLGEAYMEGNWHCDDLAALLTLFAKNRDSLARAVHGKLLQLLGCRLRHLLLRANTRRGARRNIEAHYDLGNDFYALWLDPSMTYSAALFDAPGEPLEAAQQRKYARILHQLGARPGQTLLEIGCGWGGFAEVAARDFGCRVHGLTLSPAQLAYARERAERGGFARQTSFELRDYRDMQGRFDHIVSIEMIEAVGERYWPQYFGQLARLLAPGGHAVIQAITIADPLFARYRRGTDFIQRHIFPGGMLPSPAAFRREAARQGLATIGDHAFAQDYARTLAIWHRRFVAARDAVRALGFDEGFVRMWCFYLAYCEAGFRAGTLDVHQFELAHAV